MGAVTSRVSRGMAATVSKASTPAGPSKSSTVHSAPRGPSHHRKAAADVNAGTVSSAPPPRRQTPDEWADALKRMSAVISSSAWDGETALPADGQHSAQRSATLTERLPSRHATGLEGEEDVDGNVGGISKGDADGMVAEDKVAVPNRLRQRDVLSLFKLRREDPEKWTVEQVCKRFSVGEKDMSNLLRFSRTYLAREDSDGTLRGYYNPAVNKTISRFERD